MGTATDTIAYTYGDSDWGDLLTAYDGTAFSYDGIGNLLSDGTWTYAWEHGRELASMTNGTDTWTYTYNADGLRTRRTDGETTYDYVYLDGQLVKMTVDGIQMFFAYDANGRPMSIYYNQSIFYYYVTNLQGDVVGIIDKDGTPLVSYTYDAWGNILSITGSRASNLGQLNPLRYRSYVYDSETGLYYLQSRYYNPEWGRFINADAFVSTGQGILGNNMFAYCLNNPVNGCDPFGTCWHRLDFWNDCEKCGGETIDEKLENLRGTVSSGFTASFSTGIWAFGVQLSRSADLKGNVDYQLTLYGGISTGTPAFDVGIVGTVTNAPDVESLEGLGYNIGASGALGASVGLDGVIIPDKSGEIGYVGSSAYAGIGAGMDCHIMWGETYSIWGYNLFDALECFLVGE